MFRFVEVNEMKREMEQQVWTFFFFFFCAQENIRLHTWPGQPHPAKLYSDYKIELLASFKGVTSVKRLLNVLGWAELETTRKNINVR